MPRLVWSSLNKQQVGKYFEYFVKMELTMFGFEVFSSEVDDRGIDFITRRKHGSFIEDQAKAIRSFAGYVYLRKCHFELSTFRYVALGILVDDQPPKAFLIPSTVWKTPDNVFVSRDYEKPSQKSQPEWGIQVSKMNLPRLEEFSLEKMLDQLSVG